uniref:Uncharacterized protein n=1 Tax=viral metagenome TaxID=1070528 RepID=A0A6C0JTD9_9ZZZZ
MFRTFFTIIKKAASLFGYKFDSNMIRINFCTTLNVDIKIVNTPEQIQLDTKRDPYFLYEDEMILWFIKRKQKEAELKASRGVSSDKQKKDPFFEKEFEESPQYLPRIELSVQLSIGISIYIENFSFKEFKWRSIWNLCVS